MRKTLPIAVLAASLSAFDASACDCFGNESYCATLDPSWFVNPVSTVLAVKLTDYYYGITVKVVQVIGGQQLPDDTLTVWGDNGALCRIYLNGFAIGDTVVFGLNECDLWGNTITAGFPPDLEQPGDYMVSVCGVYWLNYDNGLVTGPITGSTVQSMTLGEFTEVVASCSQANGIPVHGTSEGLIVRYEDGVPWLQLQQPAQARLTVRDMAGRDVLRRSWGGSSFPLTGLASGTYAVLVVQGPVVTSRKVLVP